MCKTQIIDLFSGIGGFSLAGRWIGWETVSFCEIDKFCQQVLKKHWPEVPVHDDIKTLTRQKLIEYGWKNTNRTILTGGFPCQPFSVAGKQRGQQDNRYLWPEMLRVISEVRPDWIVAENVTGIIKLALVQALTSLENEGYQTETYIIPACGVNAPHRRDRVWIVAYSHKQHGNLSGFCPSEVSQQSTPKIRIDTNPHSTRRQEQYFAEKSERTGYGAGLSFENWQSWPTQSPVCGGDARIPRRMDRIKALGNAIVPQVVFEIFKAIDQCQV